MSQEILRVEHLKKYFDTPRGKLHAVDNVGFTLNAGKTLGVVGESGCGKSTLGRTVLGLTSATDGKIFFQGEDITFAKGHARRELQKKMQIIFQDPFSSSTPGIQCSSSSPIPSAPSACAGAKRRQSVRCLS